MPEKFEIRGEKLAQRFIVSIRPKIIIYDLDGVVVDPTDRLKYHIDATAKERGDFAAYERSYLEYSKTTSGDKPLEAGIKLVQALCDAYKPDYALALTSRNECARVPTLEWLKDNMTIPVASRLLFMHDDPEFDSDGNLISEPLDHAQYKKSVVKNLMQDCDIIVVVDDNPQVCEMYRSLDLYTLRVFHSSVDCLTPAGDHHPSAYELRQREKIKSISLAEAVSRGSVLSKTKEIN